MLAAMLCSLVAVAGLAAAGWGFKQHQNLQERVLQALEDNTGVAMQQLHVMKMMEMRLQWLESSMQDGATIILHVGCDGGGAFPLQLHDACVVQ